jgi:hypothetical protein
LNGQAVFKDEVQRRASARRLNVDFDRRDAPPIR